MIGKKNVNLYLNNYLFQKIRVNRKPEMEN